MTYGGLAGTFCCSDYRVEVAEQADLKRCTDDSQVVGENVGAIDGGRVHATEWVEVPLLVGNDLWEKNRCVRSRERLVDACGEC